MENKVQLDAAALETLLDQILISGRITALNKVSQFALADLYEYLIEGGYIEGSSPGNYLLVNHVSDDQEVETTDEAAEIETIDQAVETTDTLRQTLLQTIQDVKAGNMDIKKAKVISDLAGKIIDSAKVDVAFYAVSKGTGVPLAPLQLTKSEH